jgi:hypothetical protein
MAQTGSTGRFRVGSVLMKGGVEIFTGAGAPSNGTTGAGLAGPGSLYIDYTNKKLYQNTNTQASPTWQSVGDVAAAEITLPEGNILLGNNAGVASAVSAKSSGYIPVGNGTTLVPVAVSGAHLLAANGALSHAAGQIVNADISPTAAIAASKMAGYADLAGIIAAGLGNSASYVKTDAGAKTLLALNATKARGVIVVVRIDETFATGDTSQLILKVGETDDDGKGFASGVFTNAAAGSVFVTGFLNTANKAIIATLTAAAGTGTGAASVTILALPNS